MSNQTPNPPIDREAILRDAKAAIREAQLTPGGSRVHDLISSRAGVQMCVEGIEQHDYPQLLEKLPGYVCDLRRMIAAVKSGRPLEVVA